MYELHVHVIYIGIKSVENRKIPNKEQDNSIELILSGILGIH